MVTDINYYKKVIKRLLIFSFSLAALYIAFKISIFYVPFLVAFIISLIIEPLIRKVMKITNLTRKVSAIITLIIVFSIIIGLLIWGATSIVTEASNILNNLNNNIEIITFKIQNLLSGIKLDSIEMPNQIMDIINNSFNSLIEEGKKVLQVFFSRIVNIMAHIPKSIIYIAITMLATYFVCTDKMYILDIMEHHLPRNWVIKVRIQIKKSNFINRELFKSTRYIDINIILYSFNRLTVN